MSTPASNSDSVTLGDRCNFFDSQTGEFDLDREPKDPTKPAHDTDAGDSAEDDPDIPSVDELLDRDRGAHDYARGVNRDAYVAGTLLRTINNPPLYCPECWYEYETESELSEPEHHLPLVETTYIHDEDTGELVREIIKNDHRRHRHCPECGVTSFGGVLGDRPIGEFAEVLDIILDAMTDVAGSRVRRLREAAMERKRNGRSDESNIEQLLTDVRFGRQEN